MPYKYQRTISALFLILLGSLFISFEPKVIAIVLSIILITVFVSLAFKKDSVLDEEKLTKPPSYKISPLIGRNIRVEDEAYYAKYKGFFKQFDEEEKGSTENE